MNILNESKKKLRFFGVICLMVFIIELILCFNGPFAFVHKPSLIIFPPFAGRLSREEAVELTEYMQQQVALNNSYSIAGYRAIEEHYIRTNPDVGSSRITAEDVDEANNIARDMGLERFGVISVWQTSMTFHVTISIRDVRDGKNIRSKSFKSSSFEEFMKGKNPEGEDLNIQEETINVTRGVGFTDYLVLGMLGLMFLAGITAITGRHPGLLVEIVLASAILLFLFAFIHAQSANMDYVQRYIAHGGQLRLAKNTSTAQLYAFLRYGPVLIINLVYFVGYRFKNMRDLSRIWKNNFLKTKVRPWALPWVLLSALLFALSFPSFLSLEGFAPLAWICLVPLFLVLLTSSIPLGIFYGVIFGTVQALLLNYWLGTYKYVTLHMVTIAQFGLYLMFMIPLVVVIKISRRWGFLTAAACWTIFDFARSTGIFGFPWGLIGTSQYRFIPFIQIGSVTGVWGIGFVVLLCNAALAWAMAAPSMKWSWPVPSVDTILQLKITRGQVFRLLNFRRRMAFLFPVVIGLGVFIATLITGSILLYNLDKRLENAPDHATILLLQQNTDPRKREYKENTDKLRELTAQAMAYMDHNPDLIAWPEGGFRLDIKYWSREDKIDTKWGRVVRDFLDYQKDLGIWLATGTKDHEMVEIEGEEVPKRINYNSSVIMDDSGQIVDFFHKMRLVPFSEHFPLDKEKFKWLDEIFEQYNISNWGIGEERKIFSHEKMNFVTPICFEDVFSDHVRRFVLNDVDVLINMSNDYWSLTPVEGRQHGILALFRAVENQRPMLRTSCSGYTVHIDAAGRIQPGAPEAYTEGWVVAEVPLQEKKLTFYTRWGNWFPKACLAGLLASLAGFAVTAAVAAVKKRKRIPEEEKTTLRIRADA